MRVGQAAFVEGRSVMSRSFLFGVPFFLAFHASTAWAQNIDRIGIPDLESQALSGSSTVDVDTGGGSLFTTVVVTIGTDGRVVDAQLGAHERGGPGRAAALAAARQWTFRPQSFDGHPVEATGSIHIFYHVVKKPIETAKASTPFPTASPQDIEIILKRTACYGTCPSYRVSVRGDGKVSFSTDDKAELRKLPLRSARIYEGYFELWPGRHESQVDPVKVAKLIDRFRDGHFFDLDPEYDGGISHQSSTYLTLIIGDSVKRVKDYAGELSGMPLSVLQLEDEVDALAGTERWLRGNLDTIALLKAGHFDFRSAAAAELLIGIIRLNSNRDNYPRARDMIRGLIANGLPLSREVQLKGAGWYRGDLGGKQRQVAAIIAEYAAQNRDPLLFDEIADRGWLVRLDQQDLNRIFARGAGCSTAIARALVRAGADIASADDEDGKTALHLASSATGACDEASVTQRAEMVEALLDLGATVDARSKDGWTPLMLAEGPTVAERLLKAGANVNAKARGGTTPLLGVSDDRIAIMLLRAGADPLARDSDGGVREQVQFHNWPATAKWLDTHNIP